MGASSENGKTLIDLLVHCIWNEYLLCAGSWGHGRDQKKKKRLLSLWGKEISRGPGVCVAVGAGGGIWESRGLKLN